MINAYLTNATELDDHTIHLLFSANRWERKSAIESTLASGVNIVMDRYAPSGVAFSGAKEGLTIEWCKQSDVGLPAPDAVFFLDIAPEAAAKRGGYGGERYEVAPFQARVRENFNKLMVSTVMLREMHALKFSQLASYFPGRFIIPDMLLKSFCFVLPGLLRAWIFHVSLYANTPVSTDL